MIRRTIREWERISYGDDENEIPEPLADRLAAEARASAFSGLGGEGVLEHGRKGLRARGVVGVIATPDCQLEILPKIEGAGESGVDDAKLRERLIHMLAIAQDIRIDARGITHLGWQHDTILEMLIRLYCRKLADAVRQGYRSSTPTRKTIYPPCAGVSMLRGNFRPSQYRRTSWPVASTRGRPILHSIRLCARPLASFRV